MLSSGENEVIEKEPPQSNASQIPSAAASPPRFWFPDPRLSCSPGPLPTEPQTTVIIGAGIIGLFTAVCLREYQYHVGRWDDSVIVLEAASGAFTQASGYNTGILAYFGDNERMKTFADYSCRLWKRVTGANKTLSLLVDYKEQSALQLVEKTEGGDDGEGAFDWLNMPDGMMKTILEDTNEEGGATL